MSVGLTALLDDVAKLASLASTSLDDISAQAAKAGVKAAGVVIDDAAVTPRYVTGFSPARELPIIWRIARGSLRNKILVLLPAALALSLLAPWAITPLLMLGGAYLCYEGMEKLYEAFMPHAAHAHEQSLASPAIDASTLEEQKIASAIATDFILSAEIMAITLSSVAERSTAMQAIVLAIVGLGITAAVYGGVALIVKADDAGLALAGSASKGSLKYKIGCALVGGMPYFLKGLSAIGTAAMIWVGGGIIVHGLEAFGWMAPAHIIHDAGAAVSRLVPVFTGFVAWLVEAALSGIVGIIIGALAIPIMSYVIAPVWKGIKSKLPRRAVAQTIRSADVTTKSR